MDNIQYTITINQYAVLANGFDLDIVDMAIFDFISRFAHVDRCIKLSDESGRWFWVSHAMVMKHLPILGIRSEQGIANHVKKLICAGLLIRHPDCERLHRTFYRFGPEYESLVFASPQKIEKAPKNFGATPNETFGITPNENWGYNNKEIYENKEDNIYDSDSQLFVHDEKGSDDSVSVFIKRKDCAEKKSRFVPPSVDEVAEYCKARMNGIDAEKFVAYYSQSGWMLSGGRKMKDWRAAVITWERNEKRYGRNYDNDKSVRDAEFVRYWAERLGNQPV